MTLSKPIFRKMKVDKRHPMIFDNIRYDARIKIWKSDMKEIDREKLLAITVDKQLSFKKFFNQNHYTFAQISKALVPSKVRICMTPFPCYNLSIGLLWMFHDRIPDKRTTRERSRESKTKTTTKDFRTITTIVNHRVQKSNKNFNSKIFFPILRIIQCSQ